MEDERTIARYRRWYRKLLGCYPRRYRERFGESMAQTFTDLCRERAAMGKGLFGLALWMFIETCAGMIRENGTTIARYAMRRDSASFLGIVKYCAITLGGLMVAGTAALMFLARGTGEDITGIVAPALLITIVSGVVAVVTAVLQKREQQAVNQRSNRLS